MNLPALHKPPIYLDDEGNEIDVAEVARRQIDPVSIAARLQAHAIGTPCMDHTQVTAAKTLLDYVMTKASAGAMSVTTPEGLQIEVRFVSAQ